jgi:hypothetical protein
MGAQYHMDPWLIVGRRSVIPVVTETIVTKLLKNGMLKLKNNMPFALEFLLFPYAQITEL